MLSQRSFLYIQYANKNNGYSCVTGLTDQYLMRPISIPETIMQFWNSSSTNEVLCQNAKDAYYRNLLTGPPEISVIIPAYNEEESIVKTLGSLCNNITTKPVEIIVVNNNSVDATAALANACGVSCIHEVKQGITNARNGGLAAAKGKYILNADADTLYPVNWIEAMTEPLYSNERISLTYGIFSFLPLGNTGRLTYFFYECVTDLVRAFKRRFREEAVNVYGFNSGFRRLQGLEVNGFDHPPGTNEDGWLAVKLRDKGFGKLCKVSKAPVWTTDRRLQIDGGFWKALQKRIKRNL